MTDVVLEHNLLKPTAGRCNQSFRDLDLNPLKFQGSYRGEGKQSDSEGSD